MGINLKEALQKTKTKRDTKCSPDLRLGQAPPNLSIELADSGSPIFSSLSLSSASISSKSLNGVYFRDITPQMVLLIIKKTFQFKTNCFSNQSIVFKPRSLPPNSHFIPLKNSKVQNTSNSTPSNSIKSLKLCLFFQK